MDMTPPPGFWSVPAAEVRRVEDCLREEPCVSASRDDVESDVGHGKHTVEVPPPSPVDDPPPGQRLLDIPHMSWRRQHQAWLHAVQVNLAINHSSV